MTVGLLGLQGAFRDHRRHIRRLGRSDRIVRAPQDLSAVERLIIPGGESTVMAMYLRELGLLDPLRERIADGMPVWGICAGAILLAQTVDETPGVVRAMEIAVDRNAYGRQDASEVHPLAIEALDRPAFPGLFIRAPRIRAHSERVSVLARRDGDPVFVRQDRLVATTFHPELADDPVFHAYFLAL